MTELPRRRRIDERAPGLPVPEPGGASGPAGRRGLSPKAQLAVDTSVGLAVALVAIFALLTTGFLGNLSLAFLCWVAFALAWGLAAPTARLLLGRFWEAWERHVEGLQGQRADRRGPALAVGSVAAPAAKGSGEKDAERQLLEAIERHGEVTAARVALETTLTVAEADRRLRELAEKGHLEVNARDGKLVYSF